MEKVPVKKVREIFLSYPGFVPDTDDELDVYFKSPLFGNDGGTDLCVSINPGDTVQIYTHFVPDNVKRSDIQTYSLQSYISFEIDDTKDEEDTIYCEEEWLHKICLDILANDKVLREKMRKEELQKDFE
jgi:hypothetical protein